MNITQCNNEGLNSDEVQLRQGSCRYVWYFWVDSLMQEHNLNKYPLVLMLNVLNTFCRLRFDILWCYCQMWVFFPPSTFLDAQTHTHTSKTYIYSISKTLSSVSSVEISHYQEVESHPVSLNRPNSFTRARRWLTLINCYDNMITGEKWALYHIISFPWDKGCGR